MRVMRGTGTEQTIGPRCFVVAVVPQWIRHWHRSVLVAPLFRRVIDGQGGVIYPGPRYGRVVPLDWGTSLRRGECRNESGRRIQRQGRLHMVGG